MAEDAQLESFEGMVSRYVGDLLAFQPAGPYYLGGHSYGAAVAFEMAQQLQRGGHQVALLAILDYTPVADYYKVKLTPQLIVRYVRNLPYWAAGFYRRGGNGMLFSAKRKLEKVLAALANGAPLLESSNGVEVEDVLADRKQAAPEFLAFMQHQVDLVQKHVFAPYPGRITLFRARAQPLFCSFDPEMNWGALALGGVDVREVAGAHHTMLSGPYVERLAAELQCCLDETQAIRKA